jgi:HSP20 family molecular chaperone IbpA
MHLHRLAAAVYLLAAFVPAYSYGVTFCDSTPSSSSVLKSLESLTDCEPLDNLSLLRQSLRDVSDFAHRIGVQANKKPEHESQAIHAKVSTASGRLGTKPHPRYEVHETRAGFLLSATMPGLRKEDLSIEIVGNSEGHVLDISGGTNHNGTASDTRRKTLAEIFNGELNHTTHHLSQVPGEPTHTHTALRSLFLANDYPKFERRIPIPLHYDISSLEARYEDGLLVVTMAPLAKKPLNQRLKVVVD